jgi:hypothetical protein
MPKQSVVTKIRIFWVRVHLSPLKLIFFKIILTGCTEYIEKSMLKKNRAEMLIQTSEKYTNSRR